MISWDPAAETGIGARAVCQRMAIGEFWTWPLAGRAERWQRISLEFGCEVAF